MNTVQSVNTKIQNQKSNYQLSVSIFSLYTSIWRENIRILGKMDAASYRRRLNREKVDGER